MRRAKSLVVSLLLTLCVTTSAAERTSIFQPGINDDNTSEHPFSNAGIVTNFVDNDAEDLGESLGYLLRAELETVIGSPLKRYALEFADINWSDEQNSDMKKKYHAAVQNIALQYQAPLTLWGVVREQHDLVIIHSFLSLQPELRGTDLALRVSVNSQDNATFQAGVTRTRYGFSVISTPRNDFFQRRLSITSESTFFTHPSTGSTSLGSLPLGEVLHGLSMHGSWYHVETTDGRKGYIDIKDLKVLPQEITARNKPIIVHDKPDAQHSGGKFTTAQRNFRVLEIQHDKTGGPWYRVATTHVEGWIYGGDVRPQFSLPVSYFIAGLNYLRAPRNAYACQFDLASNYFSDFIAVSANKGKNTNLATAHQLFAASRLRSSKDCAHNPQKAIDAYTASIALTPYDPTAYNLRAIAHLGIAESKDQAVNDLQHALELDIQNETARRTVEDIRKAITQDTLKTSEKTSKQVESMYQAIKREHVSRNVTRIQHAYHLPMEFKGQKVLPAPKMGVILTFRNHTGTPLDLYVLKNSNGKKSQDYFHVPLSDGQKKNIRVTEGAYQIAAETPDPTVRPLFGEHAYVSQSHYELDFQVELNDTPLEQH